MADSDLRKASHAPSGDGAGERRRYQPPAIIWEQRLEVFVNQSLACSKVSGSTYVCTSNPAS